MVDDFFAIVILGAGIYVLYAARELKQAHRIVRSVIAVPEEHVRRCKDMDGLVNYMFPRMMVLACVTVLLGAYELMVSYAPFASGMAFSVLELLLYAAFFIVLIYYIHCTRGLEKRFY